MRAFQAAVLAMIALPAAAQEPADTLAACQADRAALADYATGLATRLQTADQTCVDRIAAEVTPRDTAITLCQAEVDQHQRTNITLNDRLLACEAAPKTDPADLAALQDQLDAAQAEIARLTERLTLAGLGAQPGFAYAGGSVWSSFVAEGEIANVQSDLPPLPAERCPAALEWLAAQEGAGRAIRLELWTWQDDAPRLCRRNPEGTTGLAPARPQDEAHVVIFR